MNCLTLVKNARQPYNHNLCLLRALALHLHGNDKLELETLKFFNLFLFNCEGEDTSKIRGVHLNDIPKFKHLFHLDFSFMIFISLTENSLVSLLVEVIRKSDKSVKLLRYNNHFCYVNNINALFKACRCRTCDTFFPKTGNLERHSVTCTERVKHIYSKNFQ